MVVVAKCWKLCGIWVSRHDRGLTLNQDSGVFCINIIAIFTVCCEPRDQRSTIIRVGTWKGWGLEPLPQSKMCVGATDVDFSAVLLLLGRVTIHHPSNNKRTAEKSTPVVEAVGQECSSATPPQFSGLNARYLIIYTIFISSNTCMMNYCL